MSAGKLFIVGTPIGNMEDITLRALRALREADLIAAEDTRRTAQLLARHGIGAHSQTHGRDAVPCVQGRAAARPYHESRLISYHEFNEARRTPELLQKLQQGRKIALVCDAGMPTISDPGARLIRAVVEANSGCGRDAVAVGTRCSASRVAAQQRGPTQQRSPTQQRGPTASGAATTANIELEIIPGPSAVTMALAASGFGGAPALFYGFLPHKSAQRRKTLSTLNALRFTLVFFESPYRLVKSLHDMRELLGNRQAVVARELTKKFEEILRGDLEAILKKLENRSVKGEITIVVEGLP